MRCLTVLTVLLLAGCSFQPPVFMALADYQARVDDLVRDQDSRITAAQRDRAIADAVRQYSDARADTVVEDVTGDGGRALALPSGWVAGFSAITSVEYPTGSMPPDRVDAYYLYQPAGNVAQQVVMPVAVADGSKARITYTAPHKVMKTQDTVPSQDAEAVGWYAAATLCDQLAAIYAGSSDSTIQSDSVDHESKTGHYLRLAKEYRQLYASHLGVQTPGRSGRGGSGAQVQPAGAVAELGDDAGRLTHVGNALYPVTWRR